MQIHTQYFRTPRIRLMFYAVLMLSSLPTLAEKLAASPAPASPLTTTHQAQATSGKQKEWTGQITTAMCKTTRGSMGHDCILNCVKAGEKLVLVAKNQILEIKNQDFVGLADKAGHRVTLTGAIAPGDKAITVTKIEMAGSAWHQSRYPQ